MNSEQARLAAQAWMKRRARRAEPRWRQPKQPRSWRMRPSGPGASSGSATGSPLPSGAWACFLGYGTMWLTVRGQRLPHGPDLATFAVVTLLGVASVMSGVNEARADSGVGGLSAIRRRASFLSVLIGLAAMFALGGALAHAGASQAVISVFEASAPVLVAGLFYLSTSIVQLNWPVACLGAWLLAVAAAGGLAGPAGVWGVNALAAGLAYLLMAVIEPRLRRA